MSSLEQCSSGHTTLEVIHELMIETSCLCSYDTITLTNNPGRFTVGSHCVSRCLCPVFKSSCCGTVELAGITKPIHRVNFGNWTRTHRVGCTSVLRQLNAHTACRVHFGNRTRTQRVGYTLATERAHSVSGALRQLTTCRVHFGNLTRAQRVEWTFVTLTH